MSRGRLNNPSRTHDGQDDYIEAHAAETEVLPRNTLALGDFPDQIDSRPRRVVAGRASVSRRPHVDVIAADLFTTLMAEAERLRDKARDEALSPSDSAKLLKCIDGLAKLSREMREKDKQERVEDMTDEELQQALAEYHKKLGAGE